MDVHAKLDELAAAVAGARAMPMSSSCVVNRAEILDAIDEVRRLLPSDLSRADALLSDVEAVRERAQADADSVIAGAHEERMHLVSETEVIAQAHREAGRIVAASQDEASSMRREIDDYIDAKLANFEIVLSKTMEAVHRGREKIQGRRAADELALPDIPDPDDVDAVQGRLP